MDVATGYEITALLGPGTRFEGKLDFEGRVRVDGWFRGEIRSGDTLIVGEGAEIFAEIQVATVIVNGGHIEGNIRASRAIEIHAPARVVGNLHAPSLSIGKGVEFQGSCRMDPVEPEDAPLGVRHPEPLPHFEDGPDGADDDDDADDADNAHNRDGDE